MPVKLLLCLILFLELVYPQRIMRVIRRAGGGSNISFAGSARGENVTGSAVTSVASGSTNATSGWTATVACKTFENTSVHSAPTDTAGNTYTQLTTADANHVDWGHITMWIAPNITGNAANVVTCHFTAATYDAVIVIYAADGATSSPADVQFTTTTGSGSPVTSNTFTTTNADDIIIACAGSSSGGSTFSSITIGGSSGTLVTSATADTGEAGCGYRVVTSTQSNITAVMANGAFSNAKVVGVAVK